MCGACMGLHKCIYICHRLRVGINIGNKGTFLG